MGFLSCRCRCRLSFWACFNCCWYDMYEICLLDYPNNLPDTTKKNWLEKILSEIRETKKKIANWKPGDWDKPVKNLLIDWTRTVHEIFNEKSLYLEGQDPAPTESDKFLKFVFEELWSLPNITLLDRLESLTLDYFHINSKIKTPDTIKKEKLEKLLLEIRQEKFPTATPYVWKKPAKDLLVDWTRTVHEIFNEKSFYPKGQYPAPTESDKFLKFIFEELWHLPNIELLKWLKYQTLNYWTVDTIKKDTLQKLLFKINQMIEQITTSDPRSNHGCFCDDPVKCLLKKWARRVKEIFRDENSFQTKGKDPNPIWNDRFEQFVSEDLWFLQDLELLDTLESLTLYYKKCFLLKGRDPAPKGNDMFKKFSFEESQSKRNSGMLKRQKSLVLEDQKFFRLKGGDPAPTGNDRLKKIIKRLTWQKSQELEDEEILPRKIEGPASFERFFLAPWLLGLPNLYFLKQQEEVDKAPTGNDNFKKFSFEELRSNMELLERQISLKLDDEKSFNSKEQDPAPNLIAENLICEDSYGHAIILNELLCLTLKVLTLEEVEVDPTPTGNDNFKKFSFEELRSNMELLEQQISLKLDELWSRTLLEWEISLKLHVLTLEEVDPTPTWNDKFKKLSFEELRSNMELQEQQRSLKLDELWSRTLLEWEISLKLHVLTLEEVDPTPTWNDKLKKFSFEELRSNMELLEPQRSLKLDDEKSFNPKEQDPAPNLIAENVICKISCCYEIFINELSQFTLTLKDAARSCFPPRRYIQNQPPLGLPRVLTGEKVDATPTWNDNFKIFSFEDFCSNMELLVEQIYMKSNVLTLEEEEVEVDPTPTGNDNFKKFSFEELRSNMELLELQLYLTLDVLKQQEELNKTPTGNENFKIISFGEYILPPIVVISVKSNDAARSCFPPRRYIQNQLLLGLPRGFFSGKTKELKKLELIAQGASWIKTIIEFMYLSLFLLGSLCDAARSCLPPRRNIQNQLPLGLPRVLKQQEEVDKTPTGNDNFKMVCFEELISNMEPPIVAILVESNGFFSGKTKELKKLELITQGASWIKTIIEFMYLSLFLLGSLCGFFTGKTKEVNKSELLTPKRASWSKTSIAYLCLLWLLPVSLCDDHMLRYYHTGLFYPQKSQFYFETVGYVNDQEIDMYSSKSHKNIPKSGWMEKNEGDDYWDKQTSLRKGWEKVFSDNLMILASRFNYTRSSHTLQLSYGCELHDNITTGYYGYAFDGKDFLIFDEDNLLWIPGMQKAEISAQRWNSDTAIGDGVKSYLNEHCVSALNKYIGYGREELEKKVRPEVKVWGHAQSDGLTSLHCMVYGFYPRPVDVKWVRNGKDHVLSDQTTPILPHPDGTYQIRVSVEVPTNEGDTYSCQVDHNSLEDVLTVKWEPGHDKRSFHFAILFVSAVLILLVIVFVMTNQGRGLLITKKEKGKRQQICF